VVKNGQREEHGGTVLPQSSTVWLFKPAAKVAEQEDSRVLLPRENAPEIIDLWQENAYACPGECPLHQRLCSVKLRWRVLLRFAVACTRQLSLGSIILVPGQA
jgi:hypothetical protein